MGIIAAITICILTWIVVGFFVRILAILDYRKSYNAIVNGEYVFSEYFNGITYFVKKDSPDWYRLNAKIIAMWNDGTVLLSNGHYMHSGILASLDPYTLYYKLKFNKLRQKYAKQ